MKKEADPLNLKYTNVEAIPLMVQKAQAAYEARDPASIEWRSTQLRALHKFVTNERERLMEVLVKDFQKPPAETHVAELCTIETEIVYAILHLEEWMRPTEAAKPIPLRFDVVEVRRVPLGTVLIISPWNYPIQLALNPLVAAIAGGNSAVLKFSELTPFTSSFMAETLPKYLDKEAFHYVLGEIKESTVLLDQKFELIFYTGNTTVGKIIHRAANKNLTSVVLELGGKSPAIVDENIDIKITAKRIMWGKLMNNGQTCIAPDYVLVHKKVAKPLVEAMIAACEEIVGKDPSESPYYGRICSARHFNRLIKVLQDQLKVKGSVLAYGGNTEESENYIAPSILTGLKLENDNPIMKEEIFGPLLPVIEVESLEQALAYVKKRPNPLTCMPFSKDREFLEKTFKNVNSGMAIGNDALMNIICEELPFGGVGDSGMGCYHGKFGFDTFTRPKATVIRKQTAIGELLMNSLRYNNVSYDRFKLPYKIVVRVSAPSLPSATYVTVRNLMVRYQVYLLGLIYLLVVVLAYQVGKMQ